MASLRPHDMLPSTHTAFDVPLNIKPTPVLASPAADMSLFNLRPSDNPRDVNTQILLKQALKSVLCDDHPSKEMLMKMQNESLAHLTIWAKLIQNRPGVNIPPEVIAVLDPKMLADASNKCWQTGPHGLPKANCVQPGQTLQGTDGRFYTSAHFKGAKTWQRNNTDFSAPAA